MAARRNPSAGGKPDKLMRDALLLELNREHTDDSGKTAKNYRRIAAKVIEAGREGKMDAINLIFDRADGKLAPMQMAVDVGLQVSFVLQNGPQPHIIDATPQFQITGDSNGDHD